MSDIIKCENAAFAYDGVIVTENLNFAVNEGDFLCIIGENGSGKSTLVKGILGLKKPCEGKISFGGGLKQNEIGYLPQQTVVQKDFPAAVKEVVLSGCRDRDGFKPFYTKCEIKFNFGNFFDTFQIFCNYLLAKFAKECYYI